MIMISLKSFQASKRLGRFTLKDDSDTEEKKISSGKLFFKKFQKKTSPPSMSTAAEVRAAASTVISSVDKRTIAASTAQNHRHPSTKDGQSGDRETHSVASDRQPVARGRADKIGGRSSPKPGERYSHRKTSEVGSYLRVIKSIWKLVCFSVLGNRLKELHQFSIQLLDQSRFHAVRTTVSLC